MDSLKNNKTEHQNSRPYKKTGIEFSNLWLMILICTMCSSLNAQKNYLDLTFGTEGIVLTPRFIPNTICVQKNGKILVGGEISRPYNQNITTSDYIIYRFNSDGTLDNGFGDGGKVDEFLPNSDSVTGLFETSDHKIVALIGKVSLRFMRFYPDGTKDLNFGINGTKVISFNGISKANKLQQLPDGKILIVGSSKLSSQIPEDINFYNPLIAKFDESINLDLTFFSQGYQRFNYYGDNAFTSLDVFPDGQIVAGMNYNNSIVIRKFLSNGQLNSYFGNGGVKNLYIGSNSYSIVDLKAVAGNKLLLSSSSKDQGFKAMFARLKTDGDVDEYYGDSGLSFIPNSSGHQENFVQSLMLDDGKMISAIQKWKDGYDFSLLFTNNNGSIDFELAANGEIISQMDGDQKLMTLAQQADGKILAAGYDSGHMILVRYDISELLNIESYQQHSIKIYPNPSEDFLGFLGKSYPITYNIFSITGQKVGGGELLSEAQKIDISHHEPGTYTITTGNQKFKFIKIR